MGTDFFLVLKQDQFNLKLNRFKWVFLILKSDYVTNFFLGFCINLN